MEFGANEFNNDHKNSWLQQRANLDLPFKSRNSSFEEERSPSCTSVLSTPTTVIRWNSTRKFPPHHLRNHSQSLDPSETLETLAPTGLQQSPDERDTIASQNLVHYPNDNYTTDGAFSEFPPYQESPNVQDGTTCSRNICTSEDTNFDANSPTPLDDTPYIRFAIEQLTRTEQFQRNYNRPLSSLNSSDDGTIDPIARNHEHRIKFPKRKINVSSIHHQSANNTYDNIVPDRNPAYMTPEKEREGMALTRKYRSEPSATRSLSLYPASTSGPITRSLLSHPVANVNSQIALIPIESLSHSKDHPQLTFVPTILRLPSMAILSLMCVSMIAFLLFCAIYSQKNNGILNYRGGVSSSQYILLRFGPQIFACFTFLYVQSVISAITRVMPFTVLAMKNATPGRPHEIFTRLYPVFLRPMRVGNPCIDICLSLYWLSVFTIPLQSCLLSVNLTAASPRWITFQGVAWTLIVIYILILGSTLISGFFFFHRVTGLIWDPRSLADIVVMLSQSNSLQSFSGTDILKSKEEIRQYLGVQSYRLGYWKQQNTPVILYALDQVVETSSSNLKSRKPPRNSSKWSRSEMRDVEKIFPGHDCGIRYRFMSWYLRDSSLIVWSVICFILWIDLVLVSCLPMTAMRIGFLPSIRASVDSTGFSPASFWISFGSSLLGMMLYLFFQAFEMRLRILKPWAELSKFNGSTADKSLLLDYSAALPIFVSLSALSAGHYRICITSLLSTLFVLLPIISSCIFYPVSTFPTGEIKFVSNKTALIILIILLSFYLIGILLFSNKADRIYLPHDVSCLAEIISFLYNSHILGDDTFHKVSSKAELSNRLLAEKTKCPTSMGTATESSGPNRWAFGVYKGKNGKDSMGIERLGRCPGVGLMVMSAR